jgi:pimeloyl-ACP methyl ester carboxylesterase
MSTWVLLRGLVREQRHWANFPEELRRRLPGAEIVTLDLPGNGTQHLATSPTRVEDMAEYCRQELKRRGLPPPYHLLALSLGAMVATAWCTRYPQEIAACVLINTSLRPFSPFYRRLRPHNYTKMLGAALSNDLERRERLILQLTSNRPDVQTGHLADWGAYQREFPVSRRNALRQLVAAIRFRAPLAKPPVPILVLGSTKDRLVNAYCSRKLARQWNVEAIFHPQAGHDLPLDDGPWVAQQVSAWLASVMESVPARPSLPEAARQRL